MRQLPRFLAVCFTAGLFTLSATPALAQGLLWKLSDKPNFTVVYYGDYKQTDAPGTDGKPRAEIEWKRQLTVKSIKQAEGYYDGKKVPCRWIEISVSTDRIAEEEIDHGPAGKRTYTVLVPESRVLGKTHDDDSILASMIPIATDEDGKVQGMQQVGESPAAPIDSAVLQVYPVLTLLQHYRELKEATPQQPLDLTEAIGKQLAPNDYKQLSAVAVTESANQQTRNEATIYRTDEVPTGLAGWTVKVTHNAKNSAQKRSEFQLVTTITVNLKATEVTFDKARSDLMPNLN